MFTSHRATAALRSGLPGAQQPIAAHRHQRLQHRPDRAEDRVRRRDAGLFQLVIPAVDPRMAAVRAVAPSDERRRSHRSARNGQRRPGRQPARAPGAATRRMSGLMAMPPAYEFLNVGGEVVGLGWHDGLRSRLFRKPRVGRRGSVRRRAGGGPHPPPSGIEAGMALTGFVAVFRPEHRLPGLVSSVLSEPSFPIRRGCVMNHIDHLEQRIVDLAAFLDPAAFEGRGARSLGKRRRAALREASNRLRQAAR